jgi:hypothetical protein
MNSEINYLSKDKINWKDQVICPECNKTMKNIKYSISGTEKIRLFCKCGFVQDFYIKCKNS